MTDRFKDALDLVNEQAEDEGLWFCAKYASEAYLQGALRELHEAVEQAATEAEQLRKEQYELAEDNHKLADALVFLQSTLKFNHPIMDKAKRIIKNGNA